MCLLAIVKRDSTHPAHIFTAVSYTASARLGDIITANGALVAGNADTFNNVRVILIAAHCKLNALLNDSALLINTAAHSRLGAGNNRFRYIVDCFKQLALERLSSDLAKYLVFEMLNLCVEFSPFLSFGMCYNGQNGPSTARKEEFV